MESDDVTQRIAQNLSQLCNYLIKEDKIKNNLDQAGLIFKESNRDNFMYNKNAIAVVNKIDWIFE
ncbi:MAG: hypothetical protein IPM91_02365 [Bacteroidetes bacterium]|nr:hypothetical protein [Bacteroidota bacterium]